MINDDKFVITVSYAVVVVLGFFIGVVVEDKTFQKEAIKAGVAVMVPNNETQKFEFHWLTGGTNIVERK
jgi:hypothetical protein